MSQDDLIGPRYLLQDEFAEKAGLELDKAWFLIATNKVPTVRRSDGANVVDSLDRKVRKYLPVSQFKDLF
jgi:hypothetical protein